MGETMLNKMKNRTIFYLENCSRGRREGIKISNICVVCLCSIVLWPSLSILHADTIHNVQNLTLEAAIQQTLANNTRLKEAALDIELIKKEIELSKKNILVENDYTAADPNAGHIYRASVQINPQLQFYIKQNHYNNKYVSTDSTSTLGLSYTPLNFKQRVEIKSKELSYYQKINDYQKAKYELIRDVCLAFAEIVQKEELLKLAKNDYELSREYLNNIKSLLNFGRVPKIDLIEAENEVKNAESQLRSMQLAYKVAHHNLAVLVDCNLEHYKIVPPSMKEFEISKINLESTQKKVLSESPELKVAVCLRELEELNLRLAKLEQISEWGIELAQIRNIDKDLNYYTATVKGPLFNNKWKTQKDLAQHKLISAKLKEANLVQNIMDRLQDAYFAWQIATQNLQPQNTNIEVAKEKLRIANLRFNNGTISGQDVVKAKQELINIQKAYWQAWLEHKSKMYNFYQIVFGEPVYES